MWKHAVSELRLHPGRYVATLLAIAISVGFTAAISVFMNSQSNAMQRSAALPLSTSEIIVTLENSDDAAAVAELARGVHGIAEIDPVAVSTYGYFSRADRSIQSTLYDVAPQWQRWADVIEGRWPEKPSELALARGAATELDATVGDTVSRQGDDAKLTVVGITDDPSALFATTAYTVLPEEERFTWQLGAKLEAGASAEQVRDAVAAALVQEFPQATVETGDEARAAALLMLSNEFDFTKYLLQTFAAVALLVGAITIANTFTILAAQRRRQTGLLRAIGASPGQVTGRLMIEALLLGAVGSTAGLGLGALVAWIGGFFTESNYFGLALNPVELSLAWLAGVVVTFIAAVVPSRRAARTRPLEALQTVPTAAEARRAGLLRVVVCGLAALGGVVLVILSRVDTANAIYYAVPAGALLSIGVLGGAPLYIAALLRLIGAVFGRTGPTARLAFTNAARNPQRAASTATALMLAIGLIVTLQVALATSRTSALETIEELYPTDLAASFDAGVPAEFRDRVAALEGVATTVEVPGKQVELDGFGPQESVQGSRPTVLNPRRAYEEIGIEARETRVPADGDVIVSSYGSMFGEGETIELPGAAGPITLRVKTSDNVGYNEAVVSPATFEQVAGEARPLTLWIKLADRTDASALNRVVGVVEATEGAQLTDGGAMMASVFTQVTDVVLIVLTGLLGVAVLIALVGVANTLGLSVIERQRESALLRALGMQRASLRAMLLIEAVALVGLGTLIGLAFGSFFGWLGVSSVLGMMPVQVTTVFALDGLYTAGLILACLVAAALASVLPGRRAANATPTEALAID